MRSAATVLILGLISLSPGCASSFEVGDGIDGTAYVCHREAAVDRQYFVQDFADGTLIVPFVWNHRPLRVWEELGGYFGPTRLHTESGDVYFSRAIEEGQPVELELEVRDAAPVGIWPAIDVNGWFQVRGEEAETLRVVARRVVQGPC